MTKGEQRLLNWLPRIYILSFSSFVPTFAQRIYYFMINLLVSCYCLMDIWYRHIQIIDILCKLLDCNSLFLIIWARTSKKVSDWQVHSNSIILPFVISWAILCQKNYFRSYIIFFLKECQVISHTCRITPCQIWSDPKTLAKNTH